MTIVSGGSTRDGQPRIDGTSVTVAEVYEAYAGDGLEPAEVAAAFDVPLARVHEALMYYYDNAEQMRRLEQSASDLLASATANRDDWRGSTPTDAGESLFGELSNRGRESLPGREEPGGKERQS